MNRSTTPRNAGELNGLMALMALAAHAHQEETAQRMGAGETLIIGPNPFGDGGKWSARLTTCRGVHAIGYNAAAIENVDIVQADSDEKAAGVNYRFQGNAVGLNDVPAKRERVQFDSYTGALHNLKGEPVNVTHLLFAPHGEIYGVIKSDKATRASNLSAVGRN